MAIIVVPKRIGYAGGNLKGLDRVLDEIVLAIDQGSFSNVTATSAEINALHSQGAVAADFAKLHAITATAAEVSALHSQGAVAADFAKLHALGAIVPSNASAHAHVVDLGNAATGAEIATAVNAILKALEDFGVNASA